MKAKLPFLVLGMILGLILMAVIETASSHPPCDQEQECWTEYVCQGGDCFYETRCSGD